MSTVAGKLDNIFSGKVILLYLSGLKKRIQRQSLAMANHLT